MPGVEYGQCKRSNYSLNHQFLDTDFLDSACANDFTILPAISDSDAQLLNLRMPEAVDYLSSTLESEQYFNCWKAITNNRFMKPYDLSNMRNLRDASYFEPVDDVTLLMPSTSSPRLENACWRAWYKSFRHLKELDPAKINWMKINDVTSLYGPVVGGKSIGKSDDILSSDSQSCMSCDYSSDNESTHEVQEYSPFGSEEDDSLFEFCQYDLSSLEITHSTSSVATTVSSSFDRMCPKLERRATKSILKKNTRGFLSRFKQDKQTKTHKRISFCPTVKVGVYTK
ncbi:hypothetical protein HII13_000186 [Brettanomyces bruxellensis]|uniref:DEBR0S4_07866g1_1 n=1 Tax=Dekkera bruxellensis TaxID=5007 RepID=A0A7D9CYK8_DEKBR|nr:hypothetical protein HII13_000186 [Brettanomyces bruxellensis]VUG18997.1 DEBR0S4_07866g1_1 [Brettanomyces bruxellensis]